MTGAQLFARLLELRRAGIEQAWSRVVRRDPCAWCARLPLGRRLHTREHVTPRSRGGKHVYWTNLVGACQQCNMRRGDTPVLRHLLRLARRTR